MRLHPACAACEEICFGFCGIACAGAQSIAQGSQSRRVTNIGQSNGRAGGCGRVSLRNHTREVTLVAQLAQSRQTELRNSYFFSNTESIFPAGSLNHAIDGPPS